MVQQRIFNASPDRAFIFHVTEAGKAHLLREGIDPKYGARHLKRAIEKLLVQPLSNLIATDQIRSGDWIRVDFNSETGQLVFLKEAEGLPIHTMAELVDNIGNASCTCAQQRGNLRSWAYSVHGTGFKARIAASAFTNPACIHRL